MGRRSFNPIKILLVDIGVPVMLSTAATWLLAYVVGRDRDVESKDAGVIVHGCSTEGWILNTNDFPVKIRTFRMKKDGSRGHIISTRLLRSEDKDHRYITPNHGLCILDKDDKEIGFIRPQRSSAKKKK